MDCRHGCVPVAFGRNELGPECLGREARWDDYAAFCKERCKKTGLIDSN